MKYMIPGIFFILLGCVSTFRCKQIASKASNFWKRLQIIVECRAVRKTNELETWDLYYSVTSDTSHRSPILTKRTWRVHLPENYYISLKKDWNVNW